MAEEDQEYGRGKGTSLSQRARTMHSKKRISYDVPDISALPPGQCRAVEALLGGGKYARTYPEAAKLAGMSEGTMLTHINRVRQNHTELYDKIRIVRNAQLAVRHVIAKENAKVHSSRYFRRQRRNAIRYGYGVW